MDNVIEACDGICGKAVLSTGTLTYNPFVGIGFNVAGTETEDGGEAQSADASDWGGIAITSEEAATKLASIKFKIQAKDGTYAFNIMGIVPIKPITQFQIH